MTHSTLRSLACVTTIFCLAGAAIGCGSDDNHGPVIGAPTTPVVISEGGSGNPSGGAFNTAGASSAAAGTTSNGGFGQGGTVSVGVGGSGGDPFGTGGLGQTDPFGVGGTSSSAGTVGF